MRLFILLILVALSSSCGKDDSSDPAPVVEEEEESEDTTEDEEEVEEAVIETVTLVADADDLRQYSDPCHDSDGDDNTGDSCNITEIELTIKPTGERVLWVNGTHTVRATGESWGMSKFETFAASLKDDTVSTTLATDFAFGSIAATKVFIMIDTRNQASIWVDSNESGELDDGDALPSGYFRLSE